MKNKFKVILFNDIKGSSRLWKEFEDSIMHDMIKKIINIFKKLSKKYNGTIIKFVGDSFNIAFNNIKDAINLALDFYLYLNKNPLIISNTEKIQFRTGICYGEVTEINYNLNNCKLIDYYGNIVNTASRMESKVSSVNGLAIGIYKFNQNEINNIIEIINSNKKYSENWSIETKYFTNKCNINRQKRSMKLLHDLSIKCDNLSKLKGVDNIFVVNLIPKFN
jgi:methionine synthase II (cobalamin-independent)